MRRLATARRRETGASRLANVRKVGLFPLALLSHKRPQHFEQFSNNNLLLSASRPSDVAVCHALSIPRPILLFRARDIHAEVICRGSRLHLRDPVKHKTIRAALTVSSPSYSQGTPTPSVVEATNCSNRIHLTRLASLDCKVGSRPPSEPASPAQDPPARLPG